MHSALADAGRRGAIDKAGLHSAPEVMNAALGPMPRTSLDKDSKDADDYKGNSDEDAERKSPDVPASPTKSEAAPLPS